MNSSLEKFSKAEQHGVEEFIDQLPAFTGTVAVLFPGISLLDDAVIKKADFQVSLQSGVLTA